jgi:hypothetical protein
MPPVTGRVHVSTEMLRLLTDRLVHETARMHQGSETTVVAALGSLTWDQGLQATTQHGLQTFLWHELPRKWLTDVDGKLHIGGCPEFRGTSVTAR